MAELGRERLGSDEAVSEHYREMQRRSAERRRQDRSTVRSRGVGPN